MRGRTTERCRIAQTPRFPGSLRWLVLLLVLAACDRPFVQVNTPGIELIAPDSRQVQTQSSIIVRLRVTSFRPIGIVTLDGEPMASVGSNLYQSVARLNPGENRLVVVAYDSEEVPGVDTLRFLHRTVRVGEGPTWPDAAGAMTVTPMGNGSVLVIGGARSDTSQAVDLIRRFDPEAGVFETVGHLNHARAGHTATRLPDGRILVAGGSTRGQVRFVTDLVETAEWIDPETFAAHDLTTEGDPIRRAGHTSHTRTRNGIVVVDLVGGWGDTAYRPDSRFGVRRDLRSFEVRNETIVAVHPAPGPYLEPLAGHSTTALANVAPGSPAKWLITGIVAFDSPLEAHTLIMDTGHPAGIDLQTIDDPDPPRNQHVAVLAPDGHVLLMGGKTPTVVPPGDALKAGISVYVPSFATFLSIPAESVNSLQPRWAAGATFLPDGRILLVGGFTSNGTVETSTEYVTLQ